MSNREFYESLINPARVTELCDKAQMRYNKWQKIYDRSNDEQAKCLMWYYAGMLQGLTDVLMKGKEQ